MAISYYATLFSRNVNKPKPAFRGHQLSGLLPVKSIPVPPFMKRSWNDLYWPSFAFADFLWIFERSLFAFSIPFLRPLLSISFSFCLYDLSFANERRCDESLSLSLRPPPRLLTLHIVRKTK